ncbi:MAG: HAD family hydrolase [Elusimicrobiota bacterium]|jgi:Cof subfamily protein (haloacid dehalogenase superfamily)|nr:HAD family hydrolase [Elusimicrobiota bacterium]
MSGKIVFLDIDGTLTTPDDKVPPSALEACYKAMENGHKLYVCTGRSKSEIYKSILDIGFNGVISAAGGCIETEGKMIYHKTMSLETTSRIVDYFTSKGFGFLLESNESIFLNPKIFPMIENSLGKESSHPLIVLLRKYNVPANLYRSDINKVIFFGTDDISFKDICKEFEAECNIIHGTLPIFGFDGGEINDKWTNKGDAIKRLAEYLGKDIKDTIAFGDGSNDKEMFEICANAVAMGNAIEELKKIADFVTDRVENDGLSKAFKKYGLI